jgi:hypothetical protein
MSVQLFFELLKERKGVSGSTRKARHNPTTSKSPHLLRGGLGHGGAHGHLAVTA